MSRPTSAPPHVAAAAAGVSVAVASPVAPVAAPAVSVPPVADGDQPIVAEGDRPIVAEGDDELSGRLRTAVTRLNRRLRQQSLAGLSPAQASALGSISRLVVPTLGELAEAEQVQPPTVTRLVAGLEAAGLVVRVRDQADGRVSRVRLTAEGRRTIQRIRTLKNAFLTRRLAALGPEQRAQAQALAALLEHLVSEP